MGGGRGAYLALIDVYLQFVSAGSNSFGDGD